MHILLIHQAFAALDEAGGTRHYELARGLVERGHRVTIIASAVSYLTGKTRPGQMRWVERSQPEAGITVLHTYTYPAWHKSFVHRVVSFVSFMVSSFLVGLGVTKVDLVWGTSPPIFQGVTAWLLARLKRTPFLFEVRDLWPAFAIAVGVLRNPLLVRASLWLERFLYRHADRVMVNSPGFIEHVLQHGARWVELIPNAAEPEMFDPCADGADFRAAHGFQDQFLVVYAGAHGISNDLGVILQAANILASPPETQPVNTLSFAPGTQAKSGQGASVHNAAVRFVLVGDGKEKAHLQRQAQTMGLQNVCFLPPVPKSQMSAVLAAADACVAILKPLELYKTTYPNKVFDYLAAGRPVLLVMDGVIRSVVEAAGAGVFIPPGDAPALAHAVRQMAEDPVRARAMGMAGRSYLETHFHRRTMADKLALLLEEMRALHGGD